MVVDPRGGAVHARVAARRAERPGLGVGGNTGRGGAGPACEHLHYGAHRVGAPKRRLRAAHHLDPLDLAGSDAAQVERAAALVDAHAVNQHQVVIRFAASREERHQRAFAPVALHVQTGHRSHRVGERRGAGAREVDGIDDRNRGRHPGAVLRRARGGHHELVRHPADMQGQVTAGRHRHAGHRHHGVGKPFPAGAQLEGHTGRHLQPVGTVGARLGGVDARGRDHCDAGAAHDRTAGVAHDAGDGYAGRLLRPDGRGREQRGENDEGTSGAHQGAAGRAGTDHGVSFRRPSRRTSARGRADRRDRHRMRGLLARGPQCDRSVFPRRRRSDMWTGTCPLTVAGTAWASHPLPCSTRRCRLWRRV